MKTLIHELEKELRHEGLSPIQEVLHEIPFIKVAKSKVATLLANY